MREIKFRAWDKRSEEIRFGYPVIEKGVYDHFVEDITGSCFGLGINQGDWGMELMQYTGLKDKNGKEIYEGDIVETNVNKKRWEVLQKDYSYMFATNHITQIPMWKNWTEGYFFWEFLQLLKKAKGEIEIIGNIYENPELLN